MILEELTTWLNNPILGRFPFDNVVAEYHRTGKHFVSDELLESLANARQALAEVSDPIEDSGLLREFLQTALDKADGRYDYSTYTALSLLPMPTLDDPVELVPFALHRRDRLVVQLIADTVEFELAAAAESTDLLPEMRPSRDIVNKRYRLADRITAPILKRLRISDGLIRNGPEQAARQLCMTVQPELSAFDRRILQLSMLPVYVAHDEYLFIRVLQSFETTFALAATLLNAAIRTLNEDDCATSVRLIEVAETTLRESKPLFSLLATMQVGAFQTFREFTQGASAIQSSNYKIMESLCSMPELDRLNSLAYESVPEIRDRVLARNPTLDAAVETTRATGRVSVVELDALTAAMRRFSDILMEWRKIHYNVAVHFLGERQGTGFTEGTPYLKSVQSIPVFRSIEHAEGGVKVGTI
jgi:tryptophan 2,3-dioxygenase